MTKLIVLIANPPLKVEATPEKVFPFFMFRETKDVSCREILLVLKKKSASALFSFCFCCSYTSSYLSCNSVIRDVYKLVSSVAASGEEASL